MEVRRRARRLASAFAAAMPVFVLVVSPLPAVEPAGELEIQIRDDKGDPLPAVALSLTGTTLLGDRKGTTGSEGRFVFRALPPGTFEIDAAAQGHQRVRRGGLVVDAGRAAAIVVVLPRGQLEERIEVVAREPVVDSVRTVSQLTYDLDYLENALIGIDARKYTSAIAAAPGVVGNQVRGSSFTDNVYLVDGADTNDPYFSTWGTPVITAAIEQLQLQTGAFSSEYGRATGGVTNVVTKSGGNAFSGTVDLRYGSGGMMETGDHFDPETIAYARETAEVGVGGPFVRDKLWFYAAAGYYRSEDAPAASPTVAERTTTEWLAKLTWQASPSHKLAFFGLRAPVTADNADASPFIAPEATAHWDGAERVVSAQYLGVLGPQVVVQAQAANYRQDSAGRPQSGDVTTRCAVGLFDGMTTGNSCLWQDGWNSRDVVTGSVTWAVGRHALKGGIDLQWVRSDGEVRKPGGGVDTVAPDATGATVVVLATDLVGGAGLKLGGDLYAGFVQDEWRFHPRVTGHLGLRYSDQAYTNDVGWTVLRTQLLEPRAGVAWNVTGDAKNVLKGTWSRFGYSSTLEVVHSGNQNMGTSAFYGNENVGGYFTGDGPVPVDLDGNGAIEDRVFLGSVGGASGVVYADGGDLAAPRTEEWSLSYERQVGSSSAAGATYARRRTTELIEDRYDETLGTYVIENLPGLLRTYEGVELRFRGQWRRGIVQTSYVWSKTLGNQDYSYWPGVSPEYDFPAVSTNRWGYMSTDTRHALKANGYVRLPLGFQIAGGYTYVSGYAWTLTRNALPYGTEYPEGRGQHRLPHFSQLDLDFSKTFEIGRTELRVIATVLNALDEEAVTAVNTLEGQAGEPTDYQRPRRWQAGLTFGF